MVVVVVVVVGGGLSSCLYSTFQIILPVWLILQPFAISDSKVCF